MIYDTVTEFLEHHEHVPEAELSTVHYWDNFVYFNLDLGTYELYDSDLEYYATIYHWVDLSGIPLILSHPATLGEMRFFY